MLKSFFFFFFKKTKVFQIGTDLEIECKDPNGNWGPGPVCKEV